tara:strand:- start:409 stop:801 length:393 start_codon:yes stop_codon:yes gene_type:complete
VYITKINKSKKINNYSNLIPDIIIGIREKPFKIRMGYIRRREVGEFDFEKLPEGVYSFSGQEGFVKVEVDNNGNQSWNLENWFASLDPDKNEEQHHKIIQDIKRRLNADTGIISPPKKQSKRSFLNPFNK